MSDPPEDPWGHEETTTSKLKRTATAVLLGRRKSLRVILEDLVTSHALPQKGQIVLGRAADVQIRIAMPDISRRHAALRLTRKLIEVSDLGSANGTTVRGELLTPNTWAEVSPGECFNLGEVTVIVNDAPMQERPRRSVGQSELIDALENALETTTPTTPGLTFAVMTLRCITTRRWVDVVEAMLAPHDHLAVVNDTTVVVLLNRRTIEQAEALRHTLGDHLRRIGVRLDLSLAVFGRDGVTLEALFPGATQTQPPPSRASPSQPVVANAAMLRLYEIVDDVAASPTSILILGETGTGKEVVARAIHDRSDRAKNKFLALNCAALSENLLESELFGYEKGAFTGAVGAKAGLLETADGGTVFLDELGDMPPSTQAKLLRVLEERKVWRLGGLKPRSIDVRVLAATNRDLEKRIADGDFRADLYYRLNGFAITIPPLRERADEIAPLADRFITTASAVMGKPKPLLSIEALDALRNYRWPGNIRELRNVVERAVLLARRGAIRVEDLPDDVRSQTYAPIIGDLRDSRETLDTALPPDDDILAETQRAVAGTDVNLQQEMEQLEKARIIDALDKCHGNQTRAAKMLGITRRMLISRLERYDIPRPRARKK